MKRHFYLSNNLTELEALTRELESENIDWPLVRILTDNEADVESRQLHTVESLFRQDVVRSTTTGLSIGVPVALIPLVAAYLFGLEAGYLWVPVVFFSIILLGFCTWEGGLIGFQRPHREFRRFKKALTQGKHVLVIDVPPEQQETIRAVLAKHPRIHAAGSGEGAPKWLVGLQRGWYKFIRSAP